MRVFVVVNQVREIGRRQTTALLIAALNRFGCEVALANVHDFHADKPLGDKAQPDLLVRCATLPSDKVDSQNVELFAQSELQFPLHQVKPGDLILIRTNPGRDTERQAVHDDFLDVCLRGKAKGIFVVNDPSNLGYFASKESLASVESELCPKFIVSNQPQSIAAFVRDSGVDCVIKPLTGSRGRNVIRVSQETDNLEALVANTFCGASMIVQHFVYADEPGDKRVIAVGGKILELDRQVAGIERRPKHDDFRANLHAGGTAHRLILNASERSTAQSAAELLFKHGIWLAGIDLIGDKIIEFNVFSTGGLYDAQRFTNVDYSAEIVSRLLASLNQVPFRTIF